MNKVGDSIFRVRIAFPVVISLILCVVASTGAYAATHSSANKPSGNLKSLKPSAKAFALAAKGKDVLGWQQGWWGMTTDEMLHTYGKSLKKLPEHVNYANGVYMDYQISDYQISVCKYTVGFEMKDKRLRQVELTPEASQPKSTYGWMFDELDALLSQKYGPARFRRDSTATGKERERQWVFPTTTIELHHIYLGDAPYLNVRYYPTKSSEANKL